MMYYISSPPVTFPKTVLNPRVVERIVHGQNLSVYRTNTLLFYFFCIHSMYFTIGVFSPDYGYNVDEISFLY